MTGCETSDYLAVHELLSLPVNRPRRLLADRGYDADSIRQELLFHGTRPIIPPRAGRKNPPVCDCKAVLSHNISCGYCHNNNENCMFGVSKRSEVCFSLHPFPLRDSLPPCPARLCCAAASRTYLPPLSRGITFKSMDYLVFELVLVSFWRALGSRRAPADEPCRG